MYNQAYLRNPKMAALQEPGSPLPVSFVTPTLAVGPSPKWQHVSHDAPVRIQIVVSTSVPPSPAAVIDKSFLHPPERLHKRRRLPREASPASSRPAELPERSTTAPPTVPAVRPRSHSDPTVKKRSLTPQPSGRGSPTRLLPPPPPLLRPTTFWKNTRRSGVTAASFSPSTHLIRRSTFIAAGLTFDKPIADLSAFGVESRIGTIVLIPEAAILTIALVWAEGACGVRVRPPGVTRRDRRQAVTTTPVPDATTYDYWWPYPAWSATAIGIPAPTIPTGVTDTVAEAAPTTAASMPDSTSIMTSPPITSLPATATAADLDPASPTLIQITALPPATTSTRSSFNQAKHTPFNVAYIAPLFGVLAAVFGAICGWAVFAWYSRRRAARATWGESVLLPGPQYARPPQDACAYESRGSSTEQAPLAAGRETPSAASSRPASVASEGLPVSEVERGRSWITRAFSKRAGQTGSALSATAAYEQVTGEDEESVIATPLPVARGSSSASSHGRVASPGMASEDEDDAPYDTLRHKSIRRGILDRLKIGTMRRPGPDSRTAPLMADNAPTGSRKSSVHRRPGHKRQDSDFTVQDLASSTHASTMSTPKRARSLASALESQGSLAGSGFQILEEDTEAGTLRPSTIMPVTLQASPQKDEGWSWTLSWSRANSSSARDNFTALPARRPDKRSPCPSPVRPSSSRSGETPRRFPRIDSTVLPQSPPQLMSPPLEQELFLSPKSVALPSLASIPNFDLRAPPPTPSFRAEGQIGDGSPRARKLKSHREPPLPFPTTGSPFKARLKKSVKRVTSPPSDAEGDMVDVLLSSPRHPAHDKVDDILSRGFAQRSASMLSFAHAGASIDQALVSMT